MLFALQGSCRVGGGAGVRKNRPQKRSKGEKKAFFLNRNRSVFLPQNEANDNNDQKRNTNGENFLVSNYIDIIILKNKS